MTAINLKTSSNEVIIVGEDTDLLVILTSLAANKDKIYLRKEIKKNQNNYLYYTQKSFIYTHLSKYILFIHAFSGSDTTSSFFNHGKKTAVEIIKKYEKDLSESML